MNFRLLMGTLVVLAVTVLFTGSIYAANGDLIVNCNLQFSNGSTQTTAYLPSGTIIMYGGSTSPSGWLLADGSAVSRTTYAALFAAIGTTYGVGDGSTTFNLPDFRRRVAVGAGGTATTTLGNAVGNKGGEEAHKLVTAEMPSHFHGIPWRPDGGTAAGAPFAAFFGIAGYKNSQSTGGNQPHNNMQPSLVVNYIIKQ